MANLAAVCTNRANQSKYVARKYHFSTCYDNPDKICMDNDINTIFITTRHDSHAKLVINGLKNLKHVYVEKPLAMNYSELMEIKEVYASSEMNLNLLVGFNRRFSPLTTKLMENLTKEHPKTILYRVNAGNVPAEHWVHDPEIGGGRIIGEVCHFIDYATFIAGSNVNSISAFSLNDKKNLDDSVSINLQFDNGSIASIVYTSNGNPNVPKEYIEVYSGGNTYIINDYKLLSIHSKNKKQSVKLKKQNKGHTEILEKFIHDINQGKCDTIPFSQLYESSLCTLGVLDSIREKKHIQIHN